MRKPDKYAGFAALQGQVPEQDYCIESDPRNTSICIMALHGGGIEPGASELALALAGNDFSLYRFEGQKKQNNGELHIRSENFDEPKALRLAKSSRTVVSVHGVSDEGHDHDVYLGGLDEELKSRLIEILTRSDFDVVADDNPDHSGRSRNNICNRGASAKGVQFEITERLRRKMFQGWSLKGRGKRTPVFRTFVEAVRDVLLRSSDSRFFKLGKLRG